MVDIVQVGLSVDSRQVDKGTRSLDKLGKQGKKTETATNKMSSSFKMLGAAIAAVGVVALTKKLIDQINTYTALSNKLKLVTTDAKNLADVQNMLFDIAQDTRASLEGTIDLYSRLARSTKALGLSQNDLGNVTETINQAIAVSGATAQEASAALFQLGQGLSAGALRGEELNSVMEQTPRLAQAIAEGLGVGIAELRKMGAAGELNAERVIKALQRQASTIADEFNQTEKTVAQALLQIENVALQTFGSLDSRELVDSLDEFRKIISDPAIKTGLQDMASILIDAATAAIKLASAVGTMFKFLNDLGASLGKTIAGGGDLTDLGKDLANRRADKVIVDEVKSVEDMPKVTNKQLEIEKLRELETDAIFEKMAREEEYLEWELGHNEKKLAQQQDYYDRLFNMETGSQQAMLNFGKAVRDNDLKAQIQSGSLMLANLSKTSKTAFEVQKAFSLAKAAAALPSAVIDSFNNGGGYPWGLIPAGLMLATGLQQINAIKSAQFGGAPSAPSISGGGSTSPSAPTASGLPPGSTATPDAEEVPQTQITLNIEPDALLTGQVLIDTLEELGDNGMLNGVLAT